MGRYKLTVDLPNLPKGEPVDVPPVGLVENGGSVVFEMNDDHIAEYNFDDTFGVTLKPTKEGLTKAEEEAPPETETEEGGEE